MTIKEQLNQYYKDVGIAPVVPKDVGITPVDSVEDIQKKMFCAFCCENEKKEACKEACKKAYEKNFSTTEGFQFEPRIDDVTVSQYYQDGNYHVKIPRIVVLSLSKPQPEGVPDDKPAANSKHPLGPHWRETLAMVRSLLHPFIAEKVPCPARYWKDESRCEIEKFFVHVRTAKCCSNADGKSQEPREVYENCGGYLGEELSILKPDVIVTQGNNAHWRAQEHAFEENAINISVEEVTGIETKNLIARIVNLKEGNQRVYWLRSYFPTYWGFYSRHAGPKIASECNVVGAMRKNFVRYGKAIKKFINDR